MKKKIQKLRKKINAVKEIRSHNNYVLNKKIYLIGFVLVFVTTGIIFYLLFPSDSYLIPVNYIILSFIVMFSMSHIFAKYLDDLFFQKNIKDKYNVLYIELFDIILVLFMCFSVASRLYQNTLFTIVEPIDIVLFSIVTTLLFAVYLIWLYVEEKNILYLSRSIINIILITFLFQLIFTYAITKDMMTNTIVASVYFLILLANKHLFKLKKFKNEKGYRIIKYSALTLIIIILAVVNVGSNFNIVTKPNITEKISLEYIGEISDFIILEDKVYVYDSIRSSIIVFAIDGEKLKEIQFEDLHLDMSVFDEKVRVVTNNLDDDVHNKAYHIDENNELIEESKIVCDAPLVGLELSYAYEGYSTDLCLGVPTSNLIYQDETHLIYYKDEKFYEFNSQNKSSEYDRYMNYKYNNNYIITNNKDSLSDLVSAENEGELSIYDYKMSGIGSFIHNFMGVDMIFNGDSLLTLDTSTVQRLNPYFSTSSIDLFEVIEDKYLVVTSNGSTSNSFMVLFDENGKMISTLWFENKQYQYYDNNIYFLNRSDEAIEMYKIDPMKASEFKVQQSYLDIDMFEHYFAGLYSEQNRDLYDDGECLIYILIVSVLFVIPPVDPGKKSIKVRR